MNRIKRNYSYSLLIILISILVFFTACGSNKKESDASNATDEGIMSATGTQVPLNTTEPTNLASDNIEATSNITDIPVVSATVGTNSPDATATTTETVIVSPTANTTLRPTKSPDASPVVTATPVATVTTKPTSTATTTKKPTNTPVATPKPTSTTTPNVAPTTNPPTVINVSGAEVVIGNNNGGVSQASNGDIYIKKAGEYDFCGAMTNKSIVVQAAITDKVTINLKGFSISTNVNTPILVLSADKVEISANRDTENFINDNRTVGANEDASGGAIYSDCDLEIKGNGSLTIKSSYNNGIATKDDLEIKNLTLSVTAPNNAIKGNDSVTIESGNITAISTGGNGIETKNSNISSSGKQRGNVNINSGIINIKAKNDGINAAYNVVVLAGTLTIEAEDYSIDAFNTITISNNAVFTDNSGLGCNK